MKIKSLLIGMLASVALVGCTNEDPIDVGNEELKQSELTRGDAYVNFVINTKTDSSRGTVGDKDPNADDNGHHVSGVREENTVNQLLLIIAKADDKTEELYNEVKIGTANGGNVANGFVGLVNFKQNSDGEYTLANPIRLDYTGKYKVLTVVNPVADLMTAVNNCELNHKLAYEAVLAFDGKAYEEANGVKSFQMSNKSECIINADPKEGHDKPNTPVVAQIKVERTVSKTTWRYAANFTSGKPVPTNIASKPNLYEVKVNVEEATAEIANYWFKDVEGSGDAAYDKYYFGYQLNKARHTDGKKYWVLLTQQPAQDNGGKIDENDVVAIFEDVFFTKAELTVLDNNNQYTGVIDDQTTEWTDDAAANDDKLASIIGSEETAKVLKESYSVAKTRKNNAFIQGLTFEYTMTDAEPVYYYVNLTHYALTNLTRSVYAVRHIAPAGFAQGTMGTPREMGVLGDNEYLYTPYTKDLNTLSDKQVYAKFDNNLDRVNLAAANLTFNVTDNKLTVTDNTGIFKELPTSGDGDGIAMDEGDNKTAHNNTNVGWFMQYLTENSVVDTNQKASTVTGIVLAGQIYDNEGKLVPVLYKYNQQYYRSLRALINNSTSSLTYKDANGKVCTLTENSTDEQAAAAGIDVYPNGRCFYYSSQIKHFDDNKETNGVMEYAIMRNNIYSLSVKSISDIGDAKLALTPSTPIEDIRAYVDLEVTILPWIVRFNDLDL